MVIYHPVIIRTDGHLLKHAPINTDAHEVVCSEGVRDKIEIADRMQINIYCSAVVSSFDELGNGVLLHIINRAKRDISSKATVYIFQSLSFGDCIIEQVSMWLAYLRESSSRRIEEVVRIRNITDSRAQRLWYHSCFQGECI